MRHSTVKYSWSIVETMKDIAGEGGSDVGFNVLIQLTYDKLLSKMVNE